MADDVIQIYPVAAAEELLVSSECLVEEGLAALRASRARDPALSEAEYRIFKAKGVLPPRISSRRV